MAASGLLIASRSLLAGAFALVLVAPAEAASSSTNRPLLIDSPRAFQAFVVHAEAPGEFTLRTEGGSQGVVRLFGIDIPVLAPSCLSPDGSKVACRTDAPETIARITKRTEGQVTCVPVDPNAALPTVQCLLGSDDLALVLIQGGHAYAAQQALIDQARISASWGPLHSEYMTAQESARINRRGLWSATTPSLPAYSRRRPTASR